MICKISYRELNVCMNEASANEREVVTPKPRMRKTKLSESEFFCNIRKKVRLGRKTNPRNNG